MNTANSMASPALTFHHPLPPAQPLPYNQGSDFDHNDMAMRLKPTPDHPFS